jgi:sortase A
MTADAIALAGVRPRDRTDPSQPRRTSDSKRSTWKERIRLGSRRRRPRQLPPLSRPLQVAQLGLICLFILSSSMLVEIAFVSRLTERSAQSLELATLRNQLAEGIGPVGPMDSASHVLKPGAPMAYMQIPSIGLSQVVGEGTTPSDLFRGPGHRRDSPFPGQVGVSVVMARRAGFGGPFARISDLRKGATIQVTTAQGRFTYRVLDVRVAGDAAPPPPAAGAGRLLLMTAAGRPYVPAGVVRVDADLTVAGVGGPTPLETSQTLPAAERPLGSDSRALWALALWLELLIAIVLLATWAWQRWGRGQTWIVFVPLLMLVGLNAAEEIIRVLPNLL